MFPFSVVTNCQKGKYVHGTMCVIIDELPHRNVETGLHDDVIKWKHFPRYWPFVRGIHRSPVNSPHKGQWRGALMFSLICVWINRWVNIREAGDLRRQRVHLDVSVMVKEVSSVFAAEGKHDLICSIRWDNVPGNRMCYDLDVNDTE